MTEQQLATRNTQGKTVKSWDAYEVWYSDELDWTWYVLKKYESPASEAKNPYARWFCLVRGWETEGGDVYIAEIKAQARQLQGEELEEAKKWAKEHSRYL